jgi:hypothetical protein
MDPGGATRKKSRFIAEIRFPPAPRLVDQRGQMIAALRAKVKSQFQFWQTESTFFQFGDRANGPVNQFMVGVDRIAFRLEDPASLSQFCELQSKYLKMALELVGKEIESISRIGVRTIAVHVVDSQQTFEDYATLVREKTVVIPSELGLKYTDSFVRLVHDGGAYAIGPTRKDEAWPREVFLDTENNMPEFGIGIDVDSSVVNLPYKSPDDTVNAVRRTIDLSVATEAALLHQLGVIA